MVRDHPRLEDVIFAWRGEVARVRIRPTPAGILHVADRSAVPS